MLFEPELERVGDAFGRAAQHPMAAGGSGEIAEIAQSYVLAASLGDHDAGKTVIAARWGDIRDRPVEIVG
ncbi:hypothetical protein GCM10007857_03710 [Bradyrhizobium iriomotense]|uniref:Uncharacterized protein n=1 Tax=Bradyrhizobium iriomotense TaxID=441950 RepID=A0ABQ6AU81_9BRAD|nr:hypothetical protein GCM10007857_03710 [Bradyrhizobium iriomotense]